MQEHGYAQYGWDHFCLHLHRSTLQPMVDKLTIENWSVVWVKAQSYNRDHSEQEENNYLVVPVKYNAQFSRAVIIFWIFSWKKLIGGSEYLDNFVFVMLQIALNNSLKLIRWLLLNRMSYDRPVRWLRLGGWRHQCRIGFSVITEKKPFSYLLTQSFLPCICKRLGIHSIVMSTLIWCKETVKLLSGLQLSLWLQNRIKGRTVCEWRLSLGAFSSVQWYIHTSKGSVRRSFNLSPRLNLQLEISVWIAYR